MTFVSRTNSLESGVPRGPNPGLLTDRPSTRYPFSGDVVPAIDVPYVSPCAPGATSATDSNDRFADPLLVGGAPGMRWVKFFSIVVTTMLEPTSTVGALASTRTSSAVTGIGMR